MAANKAGKKKQQRGWLANRTRSDRPGVRVTPGEPVAATDQTFRDLVIQSTEPVLVDFWAEWCGPCKQVGPVVADLARDFAGRARVVKVDVDRSPKTAERYGIRSIPTLMVFGGGEVRETLVGVQGKRELTEALGRALL